MRRLCDALRISEFFTPVRLFPCQRLIPYFEMQKSHFMMHLVSLAMWLSVVWPCFCCFLSLISWTWNREFGVRSSIYGVTRTITFCRVGPKHKSSCWGFIDAPVIEIVQTTVWWGPLGRKLIFRQNNNLHTSFNNWSRARTFCLFIGVVVLFIHSDSCCPTRICHVRISHYFFWRDYTVCLRSGAAGEGFIT